MVYDLILKIFGDRFFNLVIVILCYSNSGTCTKVFREYEYWSFCPSKYGLEAIYFL